MYLQLGVSRKNPKHCSIACSTAQTNKETPTSFLRKRSLRVNSSKSHLQRIYEEKQSSTV